MSLLGSGQASQPPSSPETSGRGAIGRAWLVIWLIGVLIGLIYVGAVFYNRRAQDRALAAAAAARQRAQAGEAYEDMGGNRFEILNFYASPRVAHRGDTVTLCYGVSNAKTVSLDPASAPVWPAFTRCFQVNPAKTTTYTLTATSASGETKTATVEVEVR